MIIFEFILELILEFIDKNLSDTKLYRWSKTALLIIIAIFFTGLFLFAYINFLPSP